MTYVTTAARGAAILLIAASAALGTAYAYKLGLTFGLFTAIALAAMALGGELMKPLAVEAAFEAGLRRPGLMIRAGLVAVVAIAYSLAAEIAVSTTSRGDLAAERAAEALAARQAERAVEAANGRRERAEAELAALLASYPKDRSVAVLGPLASPPKVCSRQIVVRAGDRHTRVVCQQPKPAPGILEELARAQRRAELEAAIAEAAPAAAAPVAAVRQADPQAAAVVHYLTAAGWPVSEASVSTWLALLPVLLLEIGSAFGWSIASAMGRAGRVPEIVSDSAPAHVPANVPARLPAPANVAANAGTHPVLAALEAAGRPMSVTELAAAMGVCRGEASKRWREVAGHVQARRAGKHTMIGLAAVH